MVTNTESAIMSYQLEFSNDRLFCVINGTYFGPTDL
jgi:hypothetical protein